MLSEDEDDDDDRGWVGFVKGAMSLKFSPWDKEEGGGESMEKEGQWRGAVGEGGGGVTGRRGQESSVPESSSS